jgi:hypothetical protein
MKKIYNPKTITTIFVSAFVIVLALFGANWQIGQAETIPTLPRIFSYEPEEICAFSEDTSVTVKGYNFIDDIDGYYYTWIRWLGPNDSLPTYIIPDDINTDGTTLIFTIESSKLLQVGEASFWIVNHPESEDPFELVGDLPINIVGCNYIFLPILSK